MFSTRRLKKKVKKKKNDWKSDVDKPGVEIVSLWGLKILGVFGTAEQMKNGEMKQFQPSPAHP